MLHHHPAHNPTSLTRCSYSLFPGSYLLLPDSAWVSPPQWLSFTLSLSSHSFPPASYLPHHTALPIRFSRWTAPCPERSGVPTNRKSVLFLHSWCPGEEHSKSLLISKWNDSLTTRCPLTLLSPTCFSQFRSGFMSTWVSSSVQAEFAVLWAWFSDMWVTEKLVLRHSLKSHLPIRDPFKVKVEFSCIW